jgi:hypothetical protein
MMDGGSRPSQSPGSDNKHKPGLLQGNWARISGSRWLPLAGIGVSLCVATAGVVVVVSTNIGRADHVASASSSPAADQTALPIATAKGPARATAVTSDGIAKTALTIPPGLRRQIKHWKAGPGGAALAAVTEQLGSVTLSAGAKLYATTERACASLASSIEPAQAGPPIPDATMQHLYGKALKELSRTAADCQHAISVAPEGAENIQVHVDKALLQQALTEFAAESQKLYQATAEIRELRHA